MYRNRNQGLLLCFVVIVLFTCTLGLSVQAQVIPEPAGMINDHAEMLTAKERDELQEAIENSNINVYILTLSSLQGESIAALANDAFESWGLADRDALLTISEQDQEVHLVVAAGSLLERGISALPLNYAGGSSSDSFAAFLDRHFVPHAREGDFKQALLESIEHLSSLYATSKSGQEAPNPAPPPAKQSEGTKTNGSALLPFLGILIVLIPILMLGARLAGRKKLLAQQDDLQATQQKSLVSIHNLEQELKPILQFSKGKSELFLKEAKDKFYHLLQNATKLSSELQALSIPFWYKRSELDTQMNSLKQQLAGFDQTIKDIQTTLHSYKEIEKEVTPKLQACAKQLQKVEVLLEQQLKELQYPLDQLVNKKAALTKTVREAETSIQFDPLYVQELLEELPEKLAKLLEEIELVRDQTAEFKKLPDKLQNTKQMLTEWIENEKLILTEIAPFAAFDKIKEQQKALEHSLQLGEIHSSTSLLNKINQWLDEAVEQVKNSVEARDWLKETLGAVEQGVQLFTASCLNELNAEIEKVQREYDAEQWEHHLAHIQLIEENRLEIVQQIPEVKHLMAANVQRYFEGQQLLTRLVKRLEESQGYQQDILQLKSDLDEQRTTLAEEQVQLEQRVNHGASRIELHGVDMIPELQGAKDQIRELAQTVRDIAQEAPLHLTAYKRAVQQVSLAVARFEEQIEASIKAKNQAEKAVQEFKASYSNALMRYRGKIKSSYYTAEYNDLLSHIEIALKRGDYQKVSTYLNNGELLLNKMKRDYQKQVEYERQLALRRQRERQLQSMRYPQNWGGGGSGRSGSSGGGSRWGGGGTSGGGSSFSRNSGGRSGWGSGGSKGGGSKW